MFRGFRAKAAMAAMLILAADATIDDFRDAFLRSFQDASRKPR
jgi:hypothetical protein